MTIDHIKINHKKKVCHQTLLLIMNSKKLKQEKAIR